MKDRDREDEREPRDRDPEYERENVTNGEDRRGTCHRTYTRTDYSYLPTF